jgi:hypothetical protein
MARLQEQIACKQEEFPKSTWFKLLKILQLVLSGPMGSTPPMIRAVSPAIMSPYPTWSRCRLSAVFFSMV